MVECSCRAGTFKASAIDGKAVAIAVESICWMMRADATISGTILRDSKVSGHFQWSGPTRWLIKLTRGTGTDMTSFRSIRPRRKMDRNRAYLNPEYPAAAIR